MFSEHINYALTASPVNNTERFLYFPALAIYSPIQDSVRTLVGGIFTALSAVTLGLCRPINRVANWTEHSQRIFTVPAQIIGNVFEIQSETLDFYNTPGINRQNYILRAHIVCGRLFHGHTTTMIQTLGKLIIFRVSCVINALCVVGIKTVFVPIRSLAFTPIALYHRGKEAKYNKIALEILQSPLCIHQLCLSLRMAVNPLAFGGGAPMGEPILDEKPYFHAWTAPEMIWLV